MRKLSIILMVALVALVSVGWYSLFSAITDDLAKYNSCIQNAESSAQKKLYQQSLMYYEESMKYKTTKDVYDKIEEVYDQYYSEEHTEVVRQSYLQAMKTACRSYPDNKAYWLKAVELCKEVNDNNNAYAILKQAKNNNVKDETIDSYYYELKYMVGLKEISFSKFYSSQNGYITVLSGDSWSIINDQGEKLSENYKRISPVSDIGVALYQYETECRLVDSQEVVRARYDFSFEDAGVFDTQTMMIPVKINGKWKYVKLNGDFLTGEYSSAGSMCASSAAVEDGEGWFIINANGEKISDKKYADIKLGLDGGYIQDGIVFAKENEKYAIYDEHMKQVCEPSFDDVDVHIENAPTAFKRGDVWGFMDSTGNILKEPEYAEARSFSNGYAAVKNSEGKWGFINEHYDLVIDYQYEDAYYFNSEGNAIVSPAEGSYCFITFVYR